MKTSKLVILLVVFTLIVGALSVTDKVYATSHNFGYETVGTSSATSIENQIIGSNFTMGAETGQKANSITVCLTAWTGTWTGKVKCAIYLRSDLSLKGTTEEKTIDLTSSKTWFTFNFVIKPSLTASANYVLVVWGEDATGTAYIVYDDPVNIERGHLQALAYAANFPDPYDASHNTKVYSIYCTYADPISSLTVTVQDSTARPIEGATVFLNDSITNGTTNSTGQVTFPSVLQGSYVLTVFKRNYADYAETFTLSGDLSKLVTMQGGFLTIMIWLLFCMTIGLIGYGFVDRHLSPDLKKPIRIAFFSILGVILLVVFLDLILLGFG